MKWTQTNFPIGNILFFIFLLIQIEDCEFGSWIVQKAFMNSVCSRKEIWHSRLHPLSLIIPFPNRDGKICESSTLNFWMHLNELQVLLYSINIVV